MATPIEATNRYFNRGLTKCYFVPMIADKEAPTRTELDAGTDLSPEISEIDGWIVSSETIETPDLATPYTGSIPGSTSAEDSSLTLYADTGGMDARTLLPRGTSGFIVWMDGGDEPDGLMDVFPIRVSSVGKTRSTDDEAATLEVQFAVPREPAENVTIPTEST